MRQPSDTRLRIMISQSLAKKYVGAVFALAVEQKLLAQVETQLMAAQNAVQSTPELARFLKHPLVPEADKQRVIAASVGAPLLPIVEGFVRQLLEHRRIEVLGASGTVFCELTDEMAGRARAFVTTAVPLSAAQQTRLEAALAKLVGKPVLINAQVDPDVIGGVCVRIGDDTIDGTLRGGLAKLSETLGSRA